MSTRGRHARVAQDEAAGAEEVAEGAADEASIELAPVTKEELQHKLAQQQAADAKVDASAAGTAAAPDAPAGKQKWSFSLDLVSTYRGPIYGVCILWVVLFHAQLDGANYIFSVGGSSVTLFNSVLCNGNFVVDAFLLLSGISLYYSWHRNPDPRDYYTKRLVKLFVPLLVVDGLYWFIRCICLGQLGGASGFIRRIAMISLWTDGTQSTWFVETLLPLYLLYPLIHEFIYSDDSAPKTALRAVLLLGASYLVLLSIYQDANGWFNMAEIGLTRIPVFILGCALGRTVFRGKKLPAWCAVLPFLVFVGYYYVLSLGVLEKPWKRFFCAVGALSFVYAAALVFLGIDKLVKKIGLYKKSLILRFFNFLGGATLEIYLAHITLNQIYQLSPWYVEGSLARYLAMAVIAIAAGLLVERFIDRPLCKRLIAAARKKPQEEPTKGAGAAGGASAPRGAQAAEGAVRPASGT